MRSSRNIALAATLAVAATHPIPVEARAPCTGDAARAVAEALAVELEIECPCDSNWRNHGEYVRCVAYTAAGLYRASEVPRACARRSVSCAARSTCGHSADAVRCCVEVERPCVEAPLHGTSPAKGRCEGSGRVCDSSQDCVVTRCRVARDARACREMKGSVAGEPGSCCENVCPAVR